MNFTREPIIETVITPKEGCKLTIRNTKGGNSEYSVDAIEVVNFGNALFFRSLERPKSFILPISDYEVVEMKETRVAIKTAQVEKSVKISSNSKGNAKTTSEEPIEKKKRRSRRRSNTTDEKAKAKNVELLKPPAIADKEETSVVTPPPKKGGSLFSPPQALISERFDERYKNYKTTEVNLPEETIAETPAAGQQEEPLISHADLDDTTDETLPDTELFETTTADEETPDLKIPIPDTDKDS